MRLYMTFFSWSAQSLLVYRLGYGPFKAEGGVRFPGGERFFLTEKNFFSHSRMASFCILLPSNYLTDLLALTG